MVCYCCQSINVNFDFQSFLGQDIEDYVRGPSQYPLVIHGKSGCGKTAVIAMAAKEISGFMDQKCCVCLRYAGSSLYKLHIEVSQLPFAIRTIFNLFVLILQVSWHHTKKLYNFAGSQVNHVTDQACV